jgi:hypothetical protein
LAHPDFVRSFLKYKSAIQHFGWAMTLSIFSAAMFLRSTQNADQFGQELDRVVAAGLALGALYKAAQGLGAVLVVKQQDRLWKTKQTDAPLPRGRFEDPDDAIRRLSGQ